MPIYEYTCHDCQRKVSLLWRSYADAKAASPSARAAAAHLTRLISRVPSYARKRFGAEGGPDDLGGSMASMKTTEIPRPLHAQDGRRDRRRPRPRVRRSRRAPQAGEDPESIEESMPDLGGENTPGAGPGADDFGVM